MHFVNPSSLNCTIWRKIWVFILRIAETVYKYIANTNTTAHGQKMMMMNTQMKLNLEDEFREFVGDFNKFFEKLKLWTEDAVQIKTWREFFEKKYPKMFDDSSETEMDIEVATTMETKPTIDKEEKLWEVREKLLSNRTHERSTNYDGVMSDDNLSLPQKVIHFQSAIDNATRRKIYYASLQGQLHEECFLQLKKVYKETLEETKITRQWVLFLRSCIYSELQFCTVSLCFFCCNFKIIKGICERDKERWK